MQINKIIVLFLIVVFNTSCGNMYHDILNQKEIILPKSLFEPQIICDWAESATFGLGQSAFSSVAVGNDGIYTAGSINGNGTFDFGNGKTVSGMCSGGNLVLIKYDTSGNAQWANSVTTGSNESWFSSVVVGNDGIYAVGGLGAGIYNFGNFITVSGTSSSGNIVLVKYDRGGKAQWARTVVAGASGTSFNSVAVGNDGIYAVGVIFGSETNFFGNSITAAGNANGRNLLLIKYDLNGNPQWARSVMAGTNTMFTSVAIGNDGIYAAGVIWRGMCDLGNGITLTGISEKPNLLLVKYDENGNVLWARSTITGLGSSWIHSLTVDDDCIYAAGAIGKGTYYLGNEVTATGILEENVLPLGSNLLLLKYDKNGNAQWAKSVATATNLSSFMSVAALHNNIYAAGYIDGNETFDFNNGKTAYGISKFRNIVLVKYDNNGDTHWVKTVIGGELGTSFASLAVGNNAVYAVGSIKGGIYDFGDGVTVPGFYEGENAVLVKYH